MGFKVNRLNLSFGFDNGYIYDAKYHVTFPNLCLFFWKWGDFVSCGCFEEGHDTDKNLWQIINNMKRQKDRTLKDELPRSVGAQYDTGDQWRNNSRKNEETKPKQKQHLVVDETDDGSKVWCCIEQYCIGAWNVRSMNQGKLEVVKQEMARVNVNILGISELKWTGMGEFNSDGHCILLIPKMMMFTLIISCLTTSNLPWFMGLIFQVPTQYFSYSTGPCFNHQSYLHMGVVFGLAPFLHSSWSYFSTDLQ